MQRQRRGDEDPPEGSVCARQDRAAPLLQGIALAPAAFLGLAAENGAHMSTEPPRRNVPSYSELLAQVKSEIHELDARALEARLEASEPPRDRA